MIGSDNHPQVVWRDYEGGEDKIYYNVFIGTSWLTTATDISSGVSSKHDPDIALDPDNQPHVVWTENVSSSDPKIYYNTLTGTGGPSAPTGDLGRPVLLERQAQYRGGRRRQSPCCVVWRRNKWAI